MCSSARAVAYVRSLGGGASGIDVEGLIPRQRAPYGMGS